MNGFWSAILPQVGIMFTAVCTLVGIIVQVRSNNNSKSNAKTHEDMMNKIDAKIDTLQAKSDASDKELKECMIDHHLNYYKDQLVSMMSRVENGYVPTTEEKHILHEQKAKYNDLGGDSYVDEMWDRLVKKELI